MRMLMMTAQKAVLAAALLATSPACSQTPAAAPLPTTVDGAYREALRLSPLPLDVEVEQRDWQANRSDSDDQYHLERLQRRIAADRRARALRVQPADLEKGCLEIELQGCGVSGGGFLRGGDDFTLHWQVQDGFTEEDGVGGGVVVLERRGASGPLTPLVWTSEGSAYEAPILVFEGEGQWLLILPGVSRGTGAGDMMRMMLFRDGVWRQVDTDWQSRAGDLLKGREVRHRPNWNFHDGLRAITPLWNAADAQCCGEAGVALLEFEVIGDKLTLTEMKPLGGDN